MASIVEYETNISLDNTDKDFIEALITEINRDLHENNIGMDCFLTVKDSVYKFTDQGKGKETRIDCAKSNDTEYRKQIGDKLKAYYLQVQKDKKTYANVCYSSECTIEELVEAICISLESGKGQYVIPE